MCSSIKVNVPMIEHVYTERLKKPVLHIKVRLPVLLCAVNTVEGDFRFCWTITPNVGQTNKENPNLVRILYMVCTLNDIYTNSTTNYTNIDTQKSVHFAVSRTETRLKMHQTCI